MKKQINVDNNGLNDLIFLSKKILRLIYIALIIAVAGGLIYIINKFKLFMYLKEVLKVLLPICLGFFFSWLIYPCYHVLIKKGINKILSIFIILSVFLLFLFLFCYIFIPVILNQIYELANYLPILLDKSSDFINNICNKLKIPGLNLEVLKKNLSLLFEKNISSYLILIPEMCITIIKKIISILFVFIISVLVSLYLLIEYDSLKENISYLFLKNNKKCYYELLKKMNDGVRRVINSTFFVALLVFIFDTIGFAIIGLKSSLLFGLFCGITDLIPYIGPYIGGGIAVIVGFSQSKTIGYLTLLIAFVVQILESYILQPIIMGKTLKLSPVAIISGLLIFGYFFGIIGMMIAVPALMILKEICIFIKERSNSCKKTLK